jgi:hypothetical protein
MNKNFVALSVVLLLSLVVVSMLFNRGLIQAVHQNVDIELETDAATYTVGDTITFAGELNFSADEEVFIQGAEIIVQGPSTQDLHLNLPTEAGTNVDLSDQTGATGSVLDVTTVLTDVVLPGEDLPAGSSLPGSTVPSGTLPGGTLPEVTCTGENDPQVSSGTLPGDTFPSTLPDALEPSVVLTDGLLPGTSITGSGHFLAAGSNGQIGYTISWVPSILGTYKAQLSITAVDDVGCSISRSEVVDFTIFAVPTATPTRTVTPTPTTKPTVTPTPFTRPSTDLSAIDLGFFLAVSGDEAAVDIDYVTSQATLTKTVSNIYSDDEITFGIPKGAFPGQGFVGAQILLVPSDVSEAAAFLEDFSLPAFEGATLTFGGLVLQLVFTDVNGNVIHDLLKAVELCFPLKTSQWLQYQDGALGIQTAKAGSSSWDTLTSSIKYGPTRVCTKTKHFSFFAVVQLAATPTPVPVATATPTATPLPIVVTPPEAGDAAPSSGLLAGLLTAGVVLILGGSYYLRRRSDQ